ncbi:MAG: FeoB-associated Cys-rich membrane protein [Lachnospiraceae bacterium]|nr:FeoB-associated Cys-rich membrane protein [Lachnospiraceae bacterium]
MTANIIAIGILVILAALAIRSIITDRKNGVPSCGYACGGNCHGCDKGDVKVKVSPAEKRRIKKLFKEYRAEHKKG